MKSEIPSVVDFEAKVMAVGGGSVTVEPAGAQAGDTLRLPATQTFEQWAGAHLYKWIKVRIQVCGSMENMPPVTPSYLPERR